MNLRELEFKTTIFDVLYSSLPPNPTYSDEDCETKGLAVYNFVYERYRNPNDLMNAEHSHCLSIIKHLRLYTYTRATCIKHKFDRIQENYRVAINVSCV